MKIKTHQSFYDYLKKGKPYYEGRSKRIYKIDEAHCLVTLIPTLSSFTYQRHRVVPGTAEIRLDFYEIAAKQFHEHGILTAFIERVDEVSYVAKLCSNPPFEVIVKNFAVGSTIRKYPGLFPEMFPFNPPVVKFDYRTAPEDQPIAEDYLRAKGYDPDEFRRRALKINEVLQNWLSPLVILDFCLIFGETSDSQLVATSEISPDSMRLKEKVDEKLCDYDKDLFRKGKSDTEIVQRWGDLLKKIVAKE